MKNQSNISWLKPSTDPGVIITSTLISILVWIVCYQINKQIQKAELELALKKAKYELKLKQDSIISNEIEKSDLRQKEIDQVRNTKGLKRFDEKIQAEEPK